MLAKSLSVQRLALIERSGNFKKHNQIEASIHESCKGLLCCQCDIAAGYRYDRSARSNRKRVIGYKTGRKYGAFLHKQGGYTS
jgi:hypothetical protein